jgi:hypothetical protein
MDINIMANYSELNGPTQGVTTASLGITAASLGITGGLDSIYKEVTDGSRLPYSIPSIYSVNQRGNAFMNNYTWDNADDWTSFHTYLTGTQPWDAERAFWHALGGYRSQNENRKQYWSAAYKRLDWGTINMVGTSSSRMHTYPRTTCYGPFGSRVMFIRNFHPTVAKTVSVWGLISTYWCSGYDGAGLQVGRPTYSSGTKYAQANGMGWTSLATYTGGSPTNAGISGSFTLQPNESCVVLLCNTFYFWTDTSNNYHWAETNAFYNMQSTWTDNWIQPDLRLTFAAHGYNEVNNGNYTSTIDSHKIWNRAATLYGDR